MNKFLKDIGLFFGLLILVCLILFEIQTWNIRRQANFKLSEEYKYIQLGHSHAECAYNDSLITNFKNLATSGESYFYTYYKLKKILEQNESIETVLIEFTNNQINSGMDNWIWEDKYISKFYPTYGSFLNFQDTGLLLKHNFISIVNNFSISQDKNFRMLLNNNYNFTLDIGGYVYHKESELEKATIFQKEMTQKNKNDNYQNISEYNILYLEKIVALCKSKDKKIIFIRSPQHIALSGRKNEALFLQIYNERFDEVPMLDFNNFEIPNSGFKDFSHLNYIGAEIISKRLDSLIKLGVLNDDSTFNSRRIIISK